MRFAAALLARWPALAAVRTQSLAAAPQHHDQAAGFYRLKVGDLEDDRPIRWYRRIRSALAEWNEGDDGCVVNALHEDPHMLMLLIRASWSTPASNYPVDGVQALGGVGKHLGLGDIAAVQATRGRSRHRFGHAPPLDHIGGLTTQDGKRVFPNADVYVAKPESDFWLSPESLPRREGCATVLPECAAIASAVIKAVSGTRLAAPRQLSTACNSSAAWSYPGHTGYEFSSKGQKILFWATSSMHCASTAASRVTAIFDIDQTALRRHGSIAPKLARGDVLIAGRI